MQMLFEESDEVRPCKGLGLLPGRIERIETALKLPQIGWNALDILRPNAMTEGIWKTAAMCISCTASWRIRRTKTTLPP